MSTEKLYVVEDEADDGGLLYKRVNSRPYVRSVNDLTLDEYVTRVGDRGPELRQFVAAIKKDADVWFRGLALGLTFEEWDDLHGRWAVLGYEWRATVAKELGNYDKLT